MVVAAIKNDGNDDDNADVSKDADDEEDLRKEVQPCIPAPIFPLTSCTCHHPTLSEFSQTPPAYMLLLEAYVEDSMMDLYTFLLFILNKFYITQYIKSWPAIGSVTSNN